MPADPELNPASRRAAVTAVTLSMLMACARGGMAPVPAAEQSVVLISIDGYRSDYLDSHAAPHLHELAARGVRARWLQPMTPTLTFPNHYTLVTGLYPVHHGIINNSFKDPGDGATFRYNDSLLVRQSRWWEGEPIWVTAERQGVRSGAFFWVGSEASIGGVRPTFYKTYDDDVPATARADTVLAWLTRSDSLRTRLALLYFSAVDHFSHDSGPGSPMMQAAIMNVDSAIGRLVGSIRALGLEDRINVIVVSDHGMSPSSPERVVYLDDYLDPARLEMVSTSPFVAANPVDGNVPAALDQLRRVPHLTVYPRDSTPASWHYTGSPRLPAISGVMDDGWIIGTHASFARRPPRAHGGEHGYDASLPDMRATFVAAGPAFRSGVVVPAFQNIHVYDLVCRILGLVPAPNDGSLDSVRVMLRP